MGVPSPLKTKRMPIFASKFDAENNPEQRLDEEEEEDEDYLAMHPSWCVVTVPSQEYLPPTQSTMRTALSAMSNQKEMVAKPVKKKKKKRRYLRGNPFPPRTSLPLTKVSVPKREIRKYPIFAHCKNSIPKTEWPEVEIQPLSSSERTSVTSSKISLDDVDGEIQRLVQESSGLTG